MTLPSADRQQQTLPCAGTQSSRTCGQSAWHRALSTRFAPPASAVTRGHSRIVFVPPSAPSFPEPVFKADRSTQPQHNHLAPTSAWTFRGSAAFVPCASSGTSAAHALAPILSPNAPGPGLPAARRPPAKSLNSANLPSCASTNINIDALEVALSCLPNRDFTTALINGLRFGFRIGYSLPRNTVCSPNRPSALHNPTVVSAAIAKEIERGHTAGPFYTPPFPHYVCSPLACVPKKPDSWRLILDLSAPVGSSINDGIARDEFACQFTPFDQILRMITQFGRGAPIAKVDLKHAFRQCPVHPDDWPLLCYCWDGSFYVDLRLPFGLRSSPALFNFLAEALCSLLQARGASPLEHYLDDFITAGPPNSDLCLSNQRLLLHTFNELGVLTSPEKTLGPDTCLPILGLEVDTVAWEVRLPPEKLREYVETLAAFRGRTSVRKRDLDSIVGILFYACRVVVPGRPFIARLVQNGQQARSPNHHVRLSSDARLDLAWWDAFLNHWNGRSLFYDSEWASAADFSLYTDASGEVGFGAVFGSLWLSGAWHPECRSKSIHWKELYAIYVALLAWGPSFRSRRILFQCDNEGVAYSLNRGRCRTPDSLDLLRHVAFLCCLYHCQVGAVHIPGTSNPVADALSRLQVSRFRRLCPHAAATPSPIPAGAAKPWELSFSDYARLASPSQPGAPTRPERQRT